MGETTQAVVRRGPGDHRSEAAAEPALPTGGAPVREVDVRGAHLGPRTWPTAVPLLAAGGTTSAGFPLVPDPRPTG
ncbi:hypothetical protein [Kineococcus sp. SYSU DK018]|uniref:hypothetical protein n=1 Tax=Kineococcus sp. SYSU DK018 TaxID=3383139 RepID=UPI003D7CE3B4